MPLIILHKVATLALTMRLNTGDEKEISTISKHKRITQRERATNQTKRVYYTLLQYNIQTSYSLSLDAILHIGRNRY